MNIDDHDRTVVSRILSRALPAWADREAAASSASLRDVQISGDADGAWRMLVDEAVERGQLLPLARAAARLRPDHRGLARLAAGLEEGRVVAGPPWPLLVAVGGLVVLVGGLVWYAGTGGQSVDLPEPAISEGSVVTTAGVDRALKAPRIGLPTTPPTPRSVSEVVERPEASTEAEPEATAIPAATPTPTPTPEPAELAAPVGGSGPCGGKRGYAYIGEATTLSAGDVWTLDGGVNVRSDYPRRDNGWDFRTSVQCVLPTGTRVRIVAAPVEVDGGAWWVAVTGDSVIGD